MVFRIGQKVAQAVSSLVTIETPQSVKDGDTDIRTWVIDKPQQIVDGPLRNVISNSSLTQALSAPAAPANSNADSSDAAQPLIVGFMAQL